MFRRVRSAENQIHACCDRLLRRTHPDTTAMMTSAERRAAWRQDLPSDTDLLCSWFTTVATEVWRRSARMARACLPGDAKLAAQLLQSTSVPTPLNFFTCPQPIRRGTCEPTLHRSP